MDTKPTVALLGTGTMGAGMARNIAAAGLPLKVWNRTPDKAEPLAEAGATVCASAADAVAGADIVITMLFDADSVASTMEQLRDAVPSGAVWLQQSTVGVDGADRLGRLAEELGLVYVDAPVLGTRKPAEDGALVVLASGPDEVQDTVAPVFEAIGQRTLWVGKAGNASRLKLVANAWVVTLIEGIAESLTLAKALGLDPKLFLEAVAGGAMDAPYVQLKGSAMLRGDFTKAFGLDGAAKDADLIVTAARDAGVDLAVFEAARDHLARALEAGHGHKDLSATFLEH
ncbi:MAG TPA: NAD(P)-dependent oxidoreductase [Nocardioidaceae bacterium]|nr:NAD(P)-dependent oxidoreductase [Nocardioidaceae bacterium]